MHSQESVWTVDAVFAVHFRPGGEAELIPGHATADPTGTVLDEGYDPYAPTLGRPVWWRIEQRRVCKVYCSTFRVEQLQAPTRLEPLPPNKAAHELLYTITVETVLPPDGSTEHDQRDSNGAENCGLSALLDPQVDNRAGPVRNGPPKPPELVLTVRRLGSGKFGVYGDSATAVLYGPVIAYGVDEVGLLKRWTHWRIEKRGDVEVAVSSFRASTTELRRLAHVVDSLPFAIMVGGASPPRWIAVEMVVADRRELALPQMVFGRAVGAERRC